MAKHEAILDRTLFDAVQAKLAASANARQLKLKASPSILTGRIFDNRGNRMTPTHTNKQGARYRYYVSHALLQKRNDNTANLMRVPAHDIETAVTKALRDHLDNAEANDRPTIPDRELVERLVERIIVTSQEIEIHLLRKANQDEGVLKIAWKVPATANVVKGVLLAPSAASVTDLGNRDILLTAVAKARAWVADLAAGRVTSFAEIAKREGKVERHIRLLAPLAFVSPHVIAKILDGSTSSTGVTALAKRLCYSWARQQSEMTD